MSAFTDRDAHGDLIYKLVMDIDAPGRTGAVTYLVDWEAAARYLTSVEFRSIAAEVDSVTIHNRDVR